MGELMTDILDDDMPDNMPETERVSLEEEWVPECIATAELTGAYQMLLALIGQSQEQDKASGPRWRRLSVDEIEVRLVRHLGEPFAKVDKDTGVLTAAHVAARALMRLQAAIELKQQIAAGIDDHGFY